MTDEPETRSPSFPLRVLVIEDDPIDFELARVALDRSGPPAVHVDHAEDLATGLVRVAAGDFDAVLLDLGLPDAGDLETLSRLLAENAPPVVVLTGRDDDDLALRAVRMGADDWLVKGQVMRGRLARVVRHAIERRSLSDALKFQNAALRILSGNDDTARREGSVEFEWLARRSDGSEFHAEVRLSSATMRGREVLQAIVRDVDEKVRAREREARERMLAEHRQRLEAIGTLASGVAHEINNPLNAMMNYADLIRDDAPAGGTVDRHAAEILREGERIAGIVRDLLAFARRDQTESSPAEVADLVRGAVSLVGPLMTKEGIRLEVSVPAGLPSVQCRPQQIQQVLVNLLTNARDALNERYHKGRQEGLVRVTASLCKLDGDDAVRVTVEDNGPGIPPKVRDRVFEPFYTTKGRGRGTGLGLSVSHGIVKEHRGAITFESEEGRFTRFHLDLRVRGNRVGSGEAGLDETMGG